MLPQQRTLYQPNSQRTKDAEQDDPTIAMRSPAEITRESKRAKKAKAKMKSPEDEPYAYESLEPAHAEV